MSYERRESHLAQRIQSILPHYEYWSG